MSEVVPLSPARVWASSRRRISHLDVGDVGGDVFARYQYRGDGHDALGPPCRAGPAGGAVEPQGADFVADAPGALLVAGSSGDPDAYLAGFARPRAGAAMDRVDADEFEPDVLGRHALQGKALAQ